MKPLLALLALLLLPLSAHAKSVAAADSIVDLGESAVSVISSADSIAPDSEFLLAAYITLDPYWHTYTYDPGDSGIPSSVEWTLPEGFAVSEAYWPPHETFNEAGLTTYGFSNEVMLTYKVKAPKDLSGAVPIKAKVEYLVCKEICIPQTAEFSFELPSGDQNLSENADLIKAWHDQSKLASDWGDVKKKPITDQASTPANHQLSILQAVLYALIGGLILNIMPCVFPVLSLKALTVVNHAKSSPAQARMEGRAYTLGVLTCFWGLAALLIALKTAGEAIGWGFQFQSPGFVAIMALLIFFIGLNLSGIFELPVLLGNLASKIGSDDSASGSFFTGLLAALVATPCTAPFMAPAIGFALSQSTLIAIIIFTFLGFGLALPFLLISHYPRLLNKLPKPGPWMETFKHFLAFPMYFFAIWLLWVLGTQTGIEGIIFTLIAAALIIFLLWAMEHCSNKSGFCKAANVLIIMALLSILIDALTMFQIAWQAPVEYSKKNSVQFSETKLAELREANTPVFVDATASWCIICKTNYKVAIGTDKVQQAFTEYGVTYMVADWTNEDAEISNYLSSFGHSGVPLYVYYAPGKEGEVLPQILTPDLILETIAP